MKKKILIGLILLLTTGCTVEYNINITNDLKIEEKVIADETVEYFDKEYEYYDRSEAIDNLWQNMIGRFENVGYEYVQNTDNTGIIVTNTYSSFEEYKNKNDIYKQYFEDIEYKEDNNIVTIESKGFQVYSGQDLEKFDIDKFELNIILPFKVINSNADKVHNNTYTWYIDKKTNDKKIMIKFDKLTTKKEYQTNLDFKLIFGIIIVVVILVLYISYRVKRNDDTI